MWNQEEIETARREAWSFEMEVLPADWEYIGDETKNGVRYMYYRDGKGGYHYETDSGWAFKEKMKKKRKKP